MDAWRVEKYDLRDMMRVLIRTDASNAIGLGHVMRCLALAEELKKRHAYVVFAMQELSGSKHDMIRSLNYEVVLLPTVCVDDSATHREWMLSMRTPHAQLRDVENTIERTPIHVNDWIVLDHYGLGDIWSEKITRLGIKVLVIDDIADRPICADIVLNQNAGAQMQMYTHTQFRYKKALLGPKFALLRSEFQRTNRHQKLEKSPIGKTDTLRFLISFGGADFSGISLRVLQVLNLLGIRGQRVKIVIGIANPHASALRALCHDSGYVCLDFTGEMANEILGADIVIGAGGVSMLERCSLGVASLVIPIAENQIPGARSAQNFGAVIYIDPETNGFDLKVKLSIENLIAQPEKRRNLAEIGQLLCDGLGCVRVVDHLQFQSLKFRKITMQDAEDLHSWRNDAATRRYSGDGQPIDFEKHCNWLSIVLTDDKQKIWIASTNSYTIGVVRFSLLDIYNSAEISVYRVPNQPGTGWGKALILASIENVKKLWPNLEFVFAKIAKSNIPSQRAFVSCGFCETQNSGWYKKNLYFI